MYLSLSLSNLARNERLSLSLEGPDARGARGSCHSLRRHQRSAGSPVTRSMPSRPITVRGSSEAFRGAPSNLTSIVDPAVRRGPASPPGARLRWRTRDACRRLSPEDRRLAHGHFESFSKRKGWGGGRSLLAIFGLRVGLYPRRNRLFM